MIDVLTQWADQDPLFKPYISSVVTLDDAKRALEVVGNRSVVGKSVIVMQGTPKLKAKL
jgi:hypothetical protein